jgi:hypothetical protein
MFFRDGILIGGVAFSFLSNPDPIIMLALEQN